MTFKKSSVDVIWKVFSPSSSARVTIVALFPRLRLVLVVTKASETLKFSSPSITSSSRTVTDEHISAPLPEPGANVKVLLNPRKSPWPSTVACLFLDGCRNVLLLAAAK